MIQDFLINFSECGVTKLTLAVCQSILSFNIGAVSKYNILLSSGIQLGGNSLYQFRKEDNVRIKHSERKISLQYRMDRRKATKQNKM